MEHRLTKTALRPFFLETYGFTLIEILVVLVLISLTTALVIPNFGSNISGIRMKSGLREILTALRYARNSAVMKKQISRVVFDLDEMVYRIEQAGAEDLHDMEESFASPWMLLGVKELPSEISHFDLQLYGEWTGYDSLKEIVFYPEGDSSGGEIEIRDEMGRSYIVTVNPFTGMIRMEEGERL
jgi:general secretion pathway protein H